MSAVECLEAAWAGRWCVGPVEFREPLSGSCEGVVGLVDLVGGLWPVSLCGRCLSLVGLWRLSVVEPVSLSLGVLAAGLLSKAAERAGEKAVEAGAGALSRFASWVRERVAGGPVAAELVRVEEVPDSPSRVNALGAALDRMVAEDPDFAAELRAQLDTAKSAGVHVASITQTAIGSQTVQVADVQGSTVSVAYGDRPPAPPR